MSGALALAQPNTRATAATTIKRTDDAIKPVTSGSLPS
jgi:hypothetical protein